MENTRFINDIKRAELAACEDAGSFLQSAVWGEFKSRFGWKAGAFLIEWADYGSLPLLALSRKLAPGVSFAYVPWGPELPANFPIEDKTRALAELARKLKPCIAHNTMFIRFDPPWFFTEGESDLQKEAASLVCTGFKRAAATVQPPDTVLIDIGLSPEEILLAMKPKWRYNIGLAGKHGVQVQTADKHGLEVFYQLLRETAARDGIAVHGINYYKTLFDKCEASGKNSGLKLRLYTASHEGDTLAAIVVLFRGDCATYLYGASSNIKRNLMSPYALQWKAIQDAKEAGCKQYDLFGIPPDDNPSHPMAGLYRFKTGFGGRIIHRPGSWDYPYRTALYALFSMAESIRKKMRDRKKKR